MPGFEGDFDHFAVDLKGNQLFVSAEKHQSVEIFNLNGEHTGSITEVKTPHTLAFDSKNNNLIVADGGDSSIKFFEGHDHHLIKRVEVAADPDAGVFDEEKRIFYVGNGGKPAQLAYSYISLISPDSMSETAKIQIPAANLEAMAINRRANLLYVNLRDRKLVGVVDLASRELKTTWAIEGLNLNTPLEFDAKTSRIFLAGRKPGKFYVINSNDGSLVASLDCIDIADDMTWDPEHHRIYISGYGGLSIYEQKSADQYQLISEIDTRHGKTSVYVPSQNKFFVIHTKTPDDIAGLQVYQVNN
jgi:DNA-binding beta-propeller fold protein YncE